MYTFKEILLGKDFGHCPKACNNDVSHNEIFYLVDYGCSSRNHGPRLYFPSDTGGHKNMAKLTKSRVQSTIVIDLICLFVDWIVC